MKTPIFLKFLLFLLFSLTAFSQSDNAELQKMYNEDQSSRMSQNIDWSVLSKQDQEREKRVYEMIS